MQELFELLSAVGQSKRCAAGEILFFEGQESEYLYALLRGKVRLYKSKWEAQKPLLGTQHTLHILNAPQCIAEMPFFMRTPYPANAECVEESELAVLDYPCFNRALSDPKLCLLFISSLCKKIQILESHISAQNQSLSTRLLTYLRANQPQLHSLTQRQIAQNLNISPESLSRALKALKSQGIITTCKGKVELL